MMSIPILLCNEKIKSKTGYPTKTSNTQATLKKKTAIRTVSGSVIEVSFLKRHQEKDLRNGNNKNEQFVI